MTIIETYIKKADEDKQAILTELYQLLKAQLPEATEKISYGMPAFYWHENVVYFAPTKKHLGFYPTASPIVAFAPEVAAYQPSKGSLKFSYKEPLPAALITKIVTFRKNEITQKLTQ